MIGGTTARLPAVLTPGTPAIRRILFVSLASSSDESGKPPVVSRSMMAALAEYGFAVEALCGPPIEPRGSAEASRTEFFRLFDSTVSAFRPDVLLACGWSDLIRNALSRARAEGIATVLSLHDLDVRDPAWFADADAVLVPSQFLADYYGEAFGIACIVLPPPIDPEDVGAKRVGTGYVTLIDPTIANGVYAFARIAAELGRVRPDIPLLVVEGEGGEATLAACGLDLRAHGNVNLMPHPPDPRRYWSVTRIALLPSLGWADRSPVVAGALANGVPVVGSDRAGIPEGLGGAGMVLPLPDRLTPATRMLPTAEDVAPWLKMIIHLWEDSGFYAEHSRRALLESRRWAAEVLGPRYIRFIDSLAVRRRGTARDDPPPGPIEEPASTRITALATAFPWPNAKPVAGVTSEFPGWLGAGTEILLARELSTETRVVVELGAWTGMSTRFIADRAPNAIIISIDHWQGSPEHRARPEFQAILPTLYESFLAECWTYRDRVIPLRTTSLAGLQTVADFGLSPDLIYVDAEHSYGAVTAELELSRRLFPRAKLVGDDYDWESVQHAVDDFARRHGLDVDRVGRRGWKFVNSPLSGAFLAGSSPGRSKAIVLVPHLNGIEWECEQGLRRLEQGGVRVVRAGGCSAIDWARNVLASDALHDGYDSLLFIDADIGFEPLDVLRLLARPEPVVAGVYTKKSRRELSSIMAEGISEVVFGRKAEGLYPLKYAAAGFLRIRTKALRRMIDQLQLPPCNTKQSRGIWPFFQPLIVAQDGGHFDYLSEDWAFSHRLNQIGVTPLADTSIRLWHYGRYGFGWEDAGADSPRYQSYIYRAKQ